MLKRVSILWVYLLITVLIIGCSPNKGIISTVDTNGNSQNDEIIVKLEIIKPGIYKDDTNYNEVDIQAKDVTLRDIVADTVMVTDKVKQGDVFLEHVTIHDTLQVYGNDASVYVSDARIANIIATSSKNLRLLFQKGVEITETLEVKDAEVIFDGAFVVKKPMKLQNSVVKLDDHAITPVLHLHKDSFNVQFVVDGYADKIVVYNEGNSNITFSGNGSVGIIENLGTSELQLAGLSVNEVVMPNKKIVKEEVPVVKEKNETNKKPTILLPPKEVVVEEEEEAPTDIKPPVVVPSWKFEEREDGFWIVNINQHEFNRIHHIIFEEVQGNQRVSFDLQQLQKQGNSIHISKQEYLALKNGAYKIRVLSNQEDVLKEVSFQVALASQEEVKVEVKVVDFYQEEHGDFMVTFDKSLQMEDIKRFSFKTHHYEWIIDKDFVVDGQILKVPYGLFSSSKLYPNLWYDFYIETNSENKMVLPSKVYFKQASVRTPKYAFGSYQLGKGTILLDDIVVSNTDERALGFFINGVPIKDYRSDYGDYVSYGIRRMDDGYIIRNFTMDVALFPNDCKDITISLLPADYLVTDMVDGFYASLTFNVCPSDPIEPMPMDPPVKPEPSPIEAIPTHGNPHDVEIKNP
ncbi:MAG: hypothetical protein Q4D47_01470 [Erysipelotrichaceae bacterium]|nr:hypothetical protein [Erysipelotrichaceae bacterium]